MHRFLVYLGAHLIDHDDRKGAILDPRIVTEPPGKFLAVLDCPAGCRKFQAPSVSDWYAVLHIKIESSHQVPCGHWSRYGKAKPRHSQIHALVVPSDHQNRGSEDEDEAEADQNFGKIIQTTDP